MDARTPAALWHRFEQAASALGFCYYVYVFERRDGTRYHKTNIPAQYYGGAQHDPFLTYCCNNFGHTLTGAEYMPDYAYLTEGERAFIEQARGSGMRSGIGVPVRTRNNPEFGGFNLGTKLVRAEFESGPAQKIDQVRSLCMAAQLRINDLGIIDNAPADGNALPLSALTPREREVFGLMKSGLDRTGIATRAGISPLTASTHIKRIYQKLGVSSRVEAITRYG